MWDLCPDITPVTMVSASSRAVLLLLSVYLKVLVLIVDPYSFAKTWQQQNLRSVQRLCLRIFWNRILILTPNNLPAPRIIPPIPLTYRSPCGGLLLPRIRPSSLVDMERFGKLRSTSKRLPLRTNLPGPRLSRATPGMHKQMLRLLA